MTWRLFEPCRVDDHRDCAEEIGDERCSCDCHEWEDDEE